MSHSGKRGEPVINLAITVILAIKLDLQGSLRKHEYTSHQGKKKKKSHRNYYNFTSDLTRQINITQKHPPVSFGQTEY